MFTELWQFDPTGLTSVNNQNNNQLSATVFPNPMLTETTISISENIENGQLLIYDVSGKLVKQIAFSGTELKLEKENLSSGVYSFTVSDQQNKKISTGKLLVQ